MKWLPRVRTARAAACAAWAWGPSILDYPGRGLEHGFKFIRAAVRAHDALFLFFRHGGADIVFGVAPGTAQVIIGHGCLLWIHNFCGDFITKRL